VTARATADPGSPVDIYKSVLTEKFAQFSGRARRAEYWWFVVVNAVVIALLALLVVIFASISDALGVVAWLAYGVYALAVLIPALAVAVRRLHDTGKSGWWLLIALVPLVGVIVLLVFYFTDSVPGENQYGASPKYV